MSRLSSFGFSGTIAHGAFAPKSSAVSLSTGLSKSLYRGRRSSAPSDLKWRLTLRAETPRQSIDSHLKEISTGVLSPSAEALFSEHVVNGRILLPGVGYLEMTFVANLGRHSAFTGIAFMRPCWLPQPGTNERCVLRCTRQGDGAFEIASWRGMTSTIESKLTTHFKAMPANIELYSKATKRKSSPRSYINQCVEAPLLKLKSILSSCWQAPAMYRVSSHQLGTCTIKNHLPKHISRHASSLAVPQEDSMCGDGPTTQDMESFL